MNLRNIAIKYVCVQVNLLVDTGSSNLAVAGSDDAQLETYFVSDDSNTFSALNDSVKVVYAQVCCPWN